MPAVRPSAVPSRLPNARPAMLGGYPQPGRSRLSRTRFRMTGLIAVLALVGAAGCGGGITENDYTCNGFCNGEPMNPQIIQAPDQGTACTEFLEICRGTGVCTSCS
jgi:hypothetical protein